MNDQLSLFETEADSEKPSLFLAILPPVEVRQRIISLRIELMRRHRLAGYQTPEANLHITLCHFNHNPEPVERIIQKASEACERAAKSTTPFEIRLDQTESFGGGAFVLTNSADNGELQAFHRLLLSEMAKHRFGPIRNSRFSPHLTLLRHEKNMSCEAIDPIRWTVDEVVLIRRFPKRDYDVLGPWRFGQ